MPTRHSWVAHEPAKEDHTVGNEACEGAGIAASSGDDQPDHGERLNNLLDNALRHTPPAGEVAVSWQPRDGQVEFEIRDNGEGIALENLPHVFEPLYKVETSRSRSTSSAGLGLAIARRLIAAHGRTLSADNVTGDGAVLRGTLPQSANAEAVHGAAENS
ncbi:MAG: sensor histidine kinase [Actinomycetota bacterium]|nr:sensor histidine kinase [Actinomycetota bacterium]